MPTSPKHGSTSRRSGSHNASAWPATSPCRRSGRCPRCAAAGCAACRRSRDAACQTRHQRSARRRCADPATAPTGQFPSWLAQADLASFARPGPRCCIPSAPQMSSARLAAARAAPSVSTGGSLNNNTLRQGGGGGGGEFFCFRSSVLLSSTAAAMLLGPRWRTWRTQPGDTAWGGKPRTGRQGHPAFGVCATSMWPLPMCHPSA